MKKLTTTLLFFFLTLYISAQNEGNVWYFGFGAGLDFNNTPPTAMTDGQINQWEGCASIADDNGTLLFYSDGISVWDAAHGIMPNGGDLNGHWSSTHSAIVIPKPGFEDIYYIFTVDELAGPNGVQYSEVDMTLPGNGDPTNPLGDVTAVKNVPLVTPTAEKITAVRHDNGHDFWVITHGWNNDEFYAFHVDCNGVNATPVTSAVGLTHSNLDPDDYNQIGSIKGSSDGSRLAVAIYTYRPTAASPLSGAFEIFDFNNATGVVSNPITDVSTDFYRAYGIEFSPDNNLLYATEATNGNVFQYDLQAGTPTDVINSRISLGQSTANTWFVGGQLQAAPDGRIYVAHNQVDYIGVINNPNTIGLGADFQASAIGLMGQTSGAGLPTFMANIFDPPIATFTFENTCFEDITDFEINYSGSIDNVEWNFDDPSSPTNTATGTNVSHVFTAPGTYNVEMTYYYLCFEETIVLPVTINELPDATIDPISPLCVNDDPVTLNAATAGGTWSGTGVSGNSFDPSISGVGEDFLITYEVTDGNGCSNSATTEVTVNDLPDPAFTFDSPVCINEGLVSLSPNEGGGVFSGAGVSGSEFNPEVSGAGSFDITYEITNNDGCTSLNVEEITVHDTTEIAIQTSGPFCLEDDPVTLQATPSGGDWSGTGVSNDVFSPADASIGNHEITYTYTNSNNCISTTANIIEVSDNMDASIDDPGIICEDNDPIQMTAADNGGEWSGDGITQDGILDPSLLSPGNHQITYTISGNCGDSDDITIFIQETPDSPIIYGDTVCSGEELTFTADTPDQGTVTWFEDEDLTVILESNSLSYSTFIDNDSITVYATVAINGCHSAPSSATGFGYNIQAEIDASPISGEPALYVDFYNYSNTDETTSYDWDLGDGNESTEFEPDHTYDESGIYEVIFTLEHEYCSDTDTITITVEEEFEVIIPNIFTPNNDGVNDNFFPTLTGAKSIYAEIYNRWGMLLYSWDDINGKWDGKTNAGVNASEGVYLYTFIIEDRKGEKHEFQGSFSLIR